jgi:thiamine-phosphate pyrophosphorylase
MKVKSEILSLYAITDRTWLKNRRLIDDLELALLGGATIVQLREKELAEELFLKEAKELKLVCDNYNVPLIINDNVEIAKLIDASGVHIGQSDTEIKEAREKLGEDKIIGVSVRTVEEALKAQKSGADYLGVGAVFSTSTKKDAKTIGLKALKAICQNVNIPVVAIGGINKNNMVELEDSGIVGVALISAIFAKKDIKRSTEDLKKIAQELFVNK